ncbi:MAG: cytochrome b562 [Planctomycetota bacterium]|nr:cytochrome b562 [Planctomycetota bacterium]MDA1114229.1 cytochrome b562 [Planctomycetota bacterium]
MKRPYAKFTFSLLTLLILTPFTVSAMSQPTSIAQEPEEHEHEEEGPLAEAMEQIKDNMRALRKTLSDPEKAAEGMKYAEGMRNSALEAMPYCPEAPAGLSELEQVKWRVDFQRKLLAVADGTLRLELALAEGKQEDAKEIYKTLGGIKKEGHDTYDPDQE